jgi:hypothetical protein
LNTEAIRFWLKDKKRHDIAANYVFAVLSLVFGIIVVFITFWITYVVVYLGWDGLSALGDLLFSKRFVLTYPARLICSSVFVVLLFLYYFRMDPSYWREYPQEQDFDPRVKEMLGDYKVFAPVLSRPQTSAKMAVDVLLTGPRLLANTWRRLQQARAVEKLDIDATARILALLHARNDAVPYEELRTTGMGPHLAGLKCVEGIDFLKVGLLLSEDLRNELSTQLK